ncbi:oxygen-independent coproporphyrinogen-3 oxidase [Butyrivibrio proteoclasticus]|uniref:Heme chaperone HemW n=1 Tax=Butyrivibrio proteoclasticus TaxID=43305 RepID=A0A1I5RKT7_9FIRM|nr:radical SAM family heme chaperone HemW [Butyrivibrio proteoclasticus]SFP58881.1 oxygen-independent coproporphyrinogen-3 oxidase [Butyrivibrio proteoclasticus]
MLKCRRQRSYLFLSLIIPIKMKSILSLYVHIPFCVKKCLYCDFLSFPASGEMIKSYFEALRREIAISSQKYVDYDVKSIFFGGGTPSFVHSQEIYDTLRIIIKSFNVTEGAEISIEANPASAMREKLFLYREAGFNRLSIGAQSLNDEELKKIGRVHDSRMFYETYENARSAGFENINIDIMSALPDQSLGSYLDTVKKVIGLKPEHISAYSLIVEEGTPFYNMDLNLPSEELDREMYHETKNLLAKSGYHRYEISNYASTAETECFHNKVYWRRGNYLGLGLGASSMVKNTRWSNITDMKQYKKAFESAVVLEHKENVQVLSKQEQMEEFMFLGLRLVEGVELKKFQELFECDIFDVYSETIDKYTQMGLLEIYDHKNGDGSKEKWLHLTDRGLDVSNTVMADFLLT